VKKITIASLFLIFVLTQSIYSAEEGFREITDSEITFQWKIDGEKLIIVLSAPTEGWVAVGFNPSRVMKDADFKLAYVDGSTVHIEDHFGTGLFTHKIDSSLGGSDDFEVLEGKEEMGATTVRFSIPLNSGDEKDKILTEGDEVKVLMAYGDRDDLSRKHKRRTSVEIKL